MKVIAFLRNEIYGEKGDIFCLWTYTWAFGENSIIENNYTPLKKNKFIYYKIIYKDMLLWVEIHIITNFIEKLRNIDIVGFKVSYRLTYNLKWLTNSMLKLKHSFSWIKQYKLYG